MGGNVWKQAHFSVFNDIVLTINQLIKNENNLLKQPFTYARTSMLVSSSVVLCGDSGLMWHRQAPHLSFRPAPLGLSVDAAAETKH